MILFVGGKMPLLYSSFIHFQISNEEALHKINTFQRNCQYYVEIQKETKHSIWQIRAVLNSSTHQATGRTLNKKKSYGKDRKERGNFSGDVRLFVEMAVEGLHITEDAFSSRDYSSSWSCRLCLRGAWCRPAHCQNERNKNKSRLS